MHVRLHLEVLCFDHVPVLLGIPFERQLLQIPLTRVHHEIDLAVLIVTQGRETKTGPERSADGSHSEERSEGRPGGCNLWDKVERFNLSRNVSRLVLDLTLEQLDVTVVGEVGDPQTTGSSGTDALRHVTLDRLMAALAPWDRCGQVSTCEQYEKGNNGYKPSTLETIPEPAQYTPPCALLNFMNFIASSAAMKKIPTQVRPWWSWKSTLSSAPPRTLVRIVSNVDHAGIGYFHLAP
jgi:hypothetical protein